MAAEATDGGRLRLSEIERQNKGSNSYSNNSTIDRYEILADKALSASRQIDQTMIDISKNILQMRAELNSLEDMMHSTSEALSTDVTGKISSASTDHRSRLINLHTTYDHINSGRIGNLQKRLENSGYRISIIKERMDKIRTDVQQSEYRDAIDSQRSQRRHVVFWVLVLTGLLLICWLVSPRINIRSILRVHPALNKTIDLSTVSSFTAEHENGNRLTHIRKQGQCHDVRLSIFDEL